MYMYDEVSFEKIIAVTDRKLCIRPFLEQIERICALKPKALILREKDLAGQEYRDLALRVRDICSRCQVELIPHTFIETAAELGTERVHLPLQKLREVFGDPLLRQFREVGSSVHSLPEALEAVKLGAGYVTAGHIYPTDCKKGLPPRGIQFLKEITSSIKIPVYGIGGIHLKTGQVNEVLESGAAGACIMSELMRY